MRYLRMSWRVYMDKKTLSNGFGSSEKLWQQSREPTKPHSAANIVVTAG